jgi:hypothetical protein
LRVRATAKISIGLLLAIVAAALLTVTPAMAATGGAGVPTSSGKAAKKKTKKKTTAETKAAPSTDTDPASGGASVGDTAAGTNATNEPTVDGSVAVIGEDGLASAPALAPDAVKQAIWAANDIIGRPYVYGGGHASFISKGYDCSGTVSYSLHGGDLLDSPLDSGSFMKWGDAGRGAWITIFTNPGHAYVVIAGIRLDTSAADDPNGGDGPRWRPLRKSNAGFKVRHPDGY